MEHVWKYMENWLVVWNMNFIFPFHIWDAILPIDEQTVYHQPVYIPMIFPWYSHDIPYKSLAVIDD